MKRHFGVAITLGLAAYVVLPMPGLSAPLSERIDQTRELVEDKRYREHVLSQTIASYNVKIDSLEGDITALQRKQDRVQATLDEKRAELLVVRGKLEQARDRLERLREELGVAEDALAVRLVELYKADEPDALTVVLQADGFADLLERTEFLERVSEQDQRIIERVRVLKEEAKRQAEELADLEARVEAAANEILAQRNELASSKLQLVDSRNELASVRSDRQSVLSQVHDSRVQLEGDLRELEAEQARVTAALQSSQETAFSGPGPIQRGSGQLIWPVSGPVVSGFGMRWGRLHAGLDIAVPAGTGIRAADSGQVVLAAWTGGYGNYVCIQHTGSLSTCYAHLSSYAVSSGSSVSQGQVIGSVGCTGHCFGDHLHFETRINGSPVDPMGYL
ncbi:MAG TPA: peptidoglycan DD-metalloendopeptidase family protein [Thermoleophilaceae bacterium]|nr:peptidoglycan DD-metalloendopeptidase family protein [Thermoleophilaceae bacterium]